MICYRDDAEFALRETSRIVAGGRQLTRKDYVEVEAALLGRSPWTDALRFEATADLLGGWELLSEATAIRRVTNVGLAVAAFSSRHGELPKRLADLVPKYLPYVPGDPADGNPLRYCVGARGAMVSSIGDDLVDDIAEILPDPNGDFDHIHDDVLFFVPSPLPREDEAGNRKIPNEPETLNE